MPKKNLRIFIGPVGMHPCTVLASALREKGIRVTYAIQRISSFRPGMEYDILLDFRGLNKLQVMFKYLYYLLKFFWQNNTFIFVSGVSLLPRNLDLPILKPFGKKTVMWFHGSDIRHYESLEAAAGKAGIKYYASKDRGASPKALKRKKRMIRLVEKYVDYIISYPECSQLLTRKYNMNFIPMDICNIRYNNIQNRRPIVVHAPSDPEYKGTSYILKVVEQLKKEGYDFEFHLFTNTLNARVRKALSEGDISVDQLFGFGATAFAIESMAAGCAVLGGNISEFSGFPRELPIIHTNPDNIYQNLKLLLENPELRRELGEKGRKYVEKYHDHRKIANDFINLITGNKGM